MKLTVLSGTYKNAGDYLIEKRALDILKKEIGSFEMNKFYRNEADRHLDEICSSDAVVFCGGPIYMPNVVGHLPKAFVECEKLPPIMIMGGGSYGAGGSIQQYNYKFNSETLKFFKQVENKGFGLGCRDMLTYRILKNNGFNDVTMTGCAAWYSDKNTAELETKDFGEIKKIVISDPGNRVYDELSVKVFNLLKQRYPNADITILCHRGINFNSDIMSKLSAGNANIKDISGSVDGFSYYDDADLHVGFRVHAHLYNLSIGNRSVLIEEDSRGTGANETLGLPSVKAFSDEIMCTNRYVRKGYYTLFGSKLNPFVDKQVDAYLDVLEGNGYRNIKNAFCIQHDTYKSMQSYVLKLKG